MRRTSVRLAVMVYWATQVQKPAVAILVGGACIPLPLSCVVLCLLHLLQQPGVVLYQGLFHYFPHLVVPYRLA